MKKVIIYIFGITISLFSVISYAKDVTIKEVRIWPSPSSTRVVFDLNEEAKYKVFTLESPSRVVIDFENTALKTNLQQISLANTKIAKIRTGSQGKNTLRVVFETEKEFKPKNFVLKPNDLYGHRLVIDLESSEKQEILALFDLGKKTKEQRIYTVVIDPGHGGEDPGAIGPLGTKEKDVVLNIAKILKQLIDKEKNLQAVLIRDGDYYVGLRERLAKTRRQKADLFISIHADAFHHPRAKGGSVYVLSDRGASSEAAKWLAESENRADLIGGVSLDDKGDTLASVLLDLSQTANEAESLDVANHVLKSLGRVTPLHKTNVERAGFAVLKSPDVPSFLVETGFISNPITEKKLRRHDYNRQLAQQVMSGIRKYFSNKPSYL